MDAGAEPSNIIELDASDEASKLLTYRRNRIDNGSARGRSQSFERTPVRTGIILGRVAHAAMPLSEKGQRRPSKRVGYSRWLKPEHGTLPQYRR